MKRIAAALLVLTLPGLALAQEPAAQAPPAAPPAPAAERTEKSDFLFVFDGVASKLKQLLTAFPDDKLAWRPAEGVRSTAEVFGHVSGGVYYLAIMMGAQPPAGHPQSFEEAGALEKKTTKAELTAALEQALAFNRQLAVDATPEQLTREVDFFGNKVNGRTMFLLLQGHLNEHLGQLIAYARSNGVTPPWSQGEGG